MASSQGLLQPRQMSSSLPAGARGRLSRCAVLGPWQCDLPPRDLVTAHPCTRPGSYAQAQGQHFLLDRGIDLQPLGRVFISLMQVEDKDKGHSGAVPTVEGGRLASCPASVASWLRGSACSAAAWGSASHTARPPLTPRPARPPLTHGMDLVKEGRGGGPGASALWVLGPPWACWRATCPLSPGYK